MASASNATTVFTVPNLVSASRVALAFGFLLTDAVPVRLLLIGVASLSDFLDGWLARRTQAASRIGALVDPVTDRFFALCVIIAYVIDGQLRPWQAGALFFRDVMTLVGWFVARHVSWLRPITFKARLVGKVVTVLQFVTFLAVLLAPATVDTLVLVVAGLGVIATVDYTLMLWRERVRVPVSEPGDDSR